MKFTFAILTYNQERIIVETLESIKQYAVDNDFELLDATMEMISTMEFEGEDKDFLDALAEVVTARDRDAIVELVTTYVNLKL